MWGDYSASILPIMVNEPVYFHRWLFTWVNKQIWVTISVVPLHICFVSCFLFQLLPFLWFDKMVDVQMRGALAHCGFSNQTSNFLIAQGFSSPAELLLVKDSDIDVMIRNSSRNMSDNVQFPFLAVRKLHAFCFGWRNATGLERTCYQLPSMMPQ